MSAPVPAPATLPGTALDRARFIARGLLEALDRVHPGLAQIMRQHADDVGETWLTRTVDRAEAFTRAEAAMYCGVKPNTISMWVDRGFINVYDGLYAKDELDAVKRAGHGQRRSIRNSHELDL